jgi:hypothetical protein
LESLAYVVSALTLGLAPAPALAQSSSRTSPAWAQNKPTSQPAAATKKEPDRDAEIFGEEEPSKRRDNKIFGESDRRSIPAERRPAASPTPSRDAAVLGKGAAAGAERRLGEKLLNLSSDKLQIGGLFYLRFNWSFSDGDRLRDHRISMPNLTDVYLDARPTRRLRAYVRGRLRWDPTLDESDPLVALAGTKVASVELDEYWLKFDIARRLYLTIGQQKVRWGTTRLWNPVDVINQIQRKFLEPFDDRNGVPMVKLHLPVESLGWNFYLAGVLDKVNSLDKGGVVGRGEFVFSTVELGLTGSYRDGIDPKFGFDFSAGIWDFDFTGELGIKIGKNQLRGYAMQVAAGLQYTIAVFHDDMLILGAEYFFNQEGSGSVDPLELFNGQRQFFYAGRNYLGLVIALPAPGKLDDWTFTLSGVCNLSDLSALARLDVSVKVLTYLKLQAYVALHLGKLGELHLGDGAFPEGSRSLVRQIYSPDDPNRPIPTQVVDLGLWLALDL